MELEPDDELVEGLEELLAELEALVRDGDELVARIDAHHVGEAEAAGLVEAARERVGYPRHVARALVEQVVLDGHEAHVAVAWLHRVFEHLVVLVLHDLLDVARHRAHVARYYLVEVLEVLAVDDQPFAHRERVHLLLLEHVHVLIAVLVHLPRDGQMVRALFVLNLLSKPKINRLNIFSKL